ncbi:hypothetical protein [Gelria sp. Kuro-4]|uniref:hypothetical protein n=1 Tax=Gelria sp. Kuro-4 TaxID=2796927 RepID=UPI001BEF1E14|nr:hypothetical protein [Gelria sp. Kuro-4]BCV23251.1 hypothetical protein kuro4_00240 [Gelria sp. Kuro-4]
MIETNEKTALAQEIDIKRASEALAAANEAVRRLVRPLGIWLGWLEKEPFAVLTNLEDLRHLPGPAEVEYVPDPVNGWCARKVVGGIVFRAWASTEEEVTRCA